MPRRLKMKQNISTLKQTRWAAMMAVCPLQVWCSSVHAPLRSFHGNAKPWKISLWKCAKPSITLQQIVRFCSNFTQSLSTWCPNDHKSLRSRGQRSTSQRDVIRAKICQIVNNSAESVRFRSTLVQTMTTCHRIYHKLSRSTGQRSRS